ncbi:MAG: type transport system permease protein, partial [Gemmatimonadaceae bacterium]|nr:type transport system permease protein [Gemmatimonadaceae bacterium]
MSTRILRGFWKLTWLETKIFTREPMGFVGTLVMPLVVFIALGRALGVGKPVRTPEVEIPFNPAILAALLIAVSAVQSLVAIISIYREGGILKRLRATPLSPVTIMGAQVAVKLAFTSLSLALLMLAGKRLFPGVMEVNVFSFTAAVLLSTFSI